MRFLAAAAILLLIMFPLAISAQNTELPPPAPEGISGAVPAAAVFSNGSMAANLPITVLARTNGSDTIYRLITDPRGRFVLSLNPDTYQIDAILDYPETPGLDFASTSEIDTLHQGNLTLIFYPAGSVAGKALSGGSPVSGARVRVSCPSSAFDYERINGESQQLSDEAGGFLFRALPTGTCILSASTDSLAGSDEIEVNRGQVTISAVELSPRASQFGLLPAAAAVVLLVALAAAAFYFSQRNGPRLSNQPPPSPPERHAAKARAKKEKEKPHEQSSAFDPSGPKAKAVLATLSEREREIVKFLLQCNGRAKRSQLQHKLLIPKTSLLRNLRSLERKNIVKLTPFGRNLLAQIEESLFR